MDINKHVKKCLKLEKTLLILIKKGIIIVIKSILQKQIWLLIYFYNQEEIKIKIIKNIINNPKDKSICRNKKNVCFHPQFSYRGPVLVNIHHLYLHLKYMDYQLKLHYFIQNIKTN